MSPMAWVRVAERLPDDQQAVLIAIISPHDPGHEPTYDVAVFCAHGFADALNAKDHAWSRGAGWGFDRDVRNYIMAWAPIEPFIPQGKERPA